MSLDLDLAEMARVFELTRDGVGGGGAAGAAGHDVVLVRARRRPTGAREQMQRHLRHYMNWIPEQYVDALAATAGFAGDAGRAARRARVASRTWAATRCS